MKIKREDFFQNYDFPLGARPIFRDFVWTSFIESPCFFDLLPPNLLLVRCHQAEIKS